MEEPLLMRPVEAGRLIGMAEQTARNKVTAGKFPIEIVISGSRKMVRRSDLEKYVEGLKSVESPPSSLSPATPPAEMAQAKAKVGRPRGRPRKIGLVSHPIGRE